MEIIIIITKEINVKRGKRNGWNKRDNEKVETKNKW